MLARLHIPKGRPDVIEALLEGVTRANQILLRENPTHPPLYASGVHYERERDEDWYLADGVWRRRKDDCEGFGPLRAAELRERGGDPGARAMVVCGRCLRRKCNCGIGKYHVITEHGDGTTEDPSRVLGMGRR